MRSSAVRVTVLGACAVVLNLGERYITGPLPFARLGVANAVTLVVLIAYGPWHALSVAVLRIVTAALLTGTFMGPTFLISLAGGLGSWAAMGATWMVGRWVIGPLGVSVLGALGNNVCQVVTASRVVLGTWELASLWPLVAVVSAGAGCMTGLVALGMGRVLFPDGAQAGLRTDNSQSAICNGEGLRGAE